MRYGTCLLLALSCALGQSGPTVVGTGDAPPVSTLAPGQIATLQVTGLKTVLTQPVRASQIPLPSQLAGISVTLNQYAHNGAFLSYTAAVPIFSIRQTNACYDGSATAGCMVTFITVQIPFEVQVVPFYNPYLTEMVVSENGVSGKGFTVYPIPDNIHVLTGCGGGACVTHADGTLVNAASPAAPGETVVVYAVGLGPTSPAVQTGQASPAPLPPFSRTCTSDSISARMPDHRCWPPRPGPGRPRVRFHPSPASLPEVLGYTKSTSSSRTPFRRFSPAAGRRRFSRCHQT
ncbi:MAG TPA: hypothetical protein VKF41_07775 [Bryobacteraceae bacterium]|nr:hypothetical protein [Bryobacteraceae bacterium]